MRKVIIKTTDGVKTFDVNEDSYPWVCQNESGKVISFADKPMVFPSLEAWFNIGNPIRESIDLVCMSRMDRNLDWADTLVDLRTVSKPVYFGMSPSDVVPEPIKYDSKCALCGAECNKTGVISMCQPRCF